MKNFIHSRSETTENNKRTCSIEKSSIKKETKLNLKPLITKGILKFRYTENVFVTNSGKPKRVISGRFFKKIMII